MAKQEKRSSQANRISFGTHEVRPVTQKDSWCYKPALSNGKPTKPEDWGYTLLFQNSLKMTVFCLELMGIL